MSIFFRIVVLLLWVVAMAEGQSSLRWASQQACRCLEQVTLAPTNLAGLEQQGDSCLQAAIWQSLTGLSQELGIDLLASPDSSWAAAAQRLADSLLLQCPAFQQLSQAIALQQLNDNFEIWQRVQGVLLEIHWNPFPPTFILLDSTGQQHQLHWIEEFDGSSRFFNGIANYRLTEVEVVWKQKQLLNPQTRRYVFFKAIVLIEEKQQLSENDYQRRYLSKRPSSKRKGRKRRKK